MVEAIKQHIGAIKSTAEGAPNLTAYLFDSKLNLILVEGSLPEKIGKEHFKPGEHILKAIPKEFAEAFIGPCQMALKGKSNGQERHVGDDYYAESFIPLPLEDGTNNIMVVSRNLSDLKLFKSMKDSKEKLKDILNSVNDVFLKTYPDGTIDFVSPSCNTVFGYTIEELLGTKISALYINPDERKEFLKQIEENGKVDGFPLKMKTKSGKVITTSVSSKLNKDHLNNQTYLYCTIKDITEQTIANEQLSERTQIFKNLYEYSGIPIVFAFPDGKLSMANKKFCEFIGYSEEELLKMNYTEFSYEEDLTIEKPFHIEMLENKRNFYEIEKRYITKTGQVKWARSTTSCIRNEDNSIDYLMGVIVDIDDSKKASLELKNSEKKFRNIFHNNGLAIYIVNTKGIITMCNEGMQQLLGYSNDELIAANVNKITFKEDIEKIKSAIEGLYKGMESVTIKKRYVTKRNKVILGEITLSLFQSPDDETPQIIGVVKDITEQTLTEEALRASEEKFRKAFENNGLAVAMTDREGRYLMCNKGMQDFLGYTEEELKKQTTISLSVKEDLEPVAKEVRKLTEENAPSVTVRKRYITKQGGIKWGDLTVSLLSKVENGRKEVLYLGVVKDITEQIQIEEALKSSEDKFRKIFENNAIGIATANREGYYTLCNEGFCNILGYSKEELYNIKSVDITHPDDIHATDQFINDIFEGRIKEYSAVKRYITKSGKVIWGEINVSAFLNSETGELTLVGVLDDITEKKNAEQALKESEEKFRKIFENNGLGVAIVNKRGEYQLLNKGAEQILGYTSEEMRGKTNLDITHPDDLEETDTRFRKLIKGEIGQYNLTKRYITKDGRTIWGDVTVSLMKLSTQEEPMLIGVMHDITEQKKNEEEIKVTNKELQVLSDELLEQNSQLENFAHITSHNLRGPLSNLIMLTNVYNKTDNTETKEELVKKFRSETERMLRTLDVLAEQIHTRKKTSVVKEKLTFKKIYKETIASLSELIDASNATIETDFACKTIEYPKTYMDSIFLNLVSNAIKYKSDKRLPIIKLRTYKKGDRKYLEISDNGLGIDLKRSRDKLFGLYKTFHNHPDARGVGLFLIKSQVESLGGSINVESEPGKGTTFTIEF